MLITGKNHPPITDISCLDGEVFLLSSKKCATSIRNFNVLCNEGNIKPKRIIECGFYLVLFSNIAAGKGVSMVLRCSISSEFKNKIKIHQLTDQFNNFKIELVHRKDCGYLDITKFTSLMTAVFQDSRLRDNSC